MFCGNHHNSLRLDMDGFCRFARRTFPTATAAHLASIVGVTISTSEKWLSEQTRPSGEHVASMIAAFGPAFLSEAVPSTRTWATPLAQAQSIRKLATELAELLAAE